nr:hypothetical protein [Tanacetum cinerariifolium]
DSVKKKTVNVEEQLQALVDQKKVIITEISIRRALKFKDEGRVDCLSNEVIFEQLTLIGENKGFFRIVTPLFPTMMVEAQADIEHIADETANMENVPTESIDPLLSRVNTLRSGEDSLKLIELTEFYTKLSDRVLSLEHIKTTQAAEIKSLKTCIVSSDEEGLEEHRNLNDQDEMMFDVNADLHGEEVVVDKDAENVQNNVDKVIKDITTVAFMEIKTVKPKTKIIVMQEPSEATTTIPIQPSSKDKGKEVVKRSKNTKAEVTEGSSKRLGNELEQESSKRQRLDDDDDSAQLKKNLEIVPDDGDDVTVDATSLSSKSQTIVDYKIHKEGRKSYYQSSEQMVILK